MLRRLAFLLSVVAGLSTASGLAHDYYSYSGYAYAPAAVSVYHAPVVHTQVYSVPVYHAPVVVQPVAVYSPVVVAQPAYAVPVATYSVHHSAVYAPRVSSYRLPSLHRAYRSYRPRGVRVEYEVERDGDIELDIDYR